ncbi:MAG: amidohydrolase [Firmicutes bacterium]|nr:amidohydrolase [Bacillota bacterium]
MSEILISGATALTLDSQNSIIEDCDIRISRDRIVMMGRNLARPSPSDSSTVIDARGKVVLPGFVNAHTHASMTLFRGYADDLPLAEWLETRIWPAEARLTKEDVYWGALLSCIEMIRSGITTFADQYFFMDQVAEAVKLSGMRAALSRGLIGIAPGSDASLDEGSELCATWHRAANDRITTMLGPHAIYTCPPDYLEKVIERARQLNVGLHIHVSETQKEVRECIEKYGKSPVAILDDIGLFEVPTLAAHVVHVSQDDMEILARNHVGVAHNPTSNLKLASGIAPVPEMLERGISVGIGTDGAASNNNLDMVEEMRLAALIHKAASGDPTVIPAFTSLRMAITYGAMALGLGHEIGSIEPGKKADLIIFDTDRPHMHPEHDIISHLVYSAHADDVSTVIINGEVVMKERKILTLDEKEILREVDRRAKRLISP